MELSRVQRTPKQTQPYLFNVKCCYCNFTARDWEDIFNCDGTDYNYSHRRF